MNPSLVVVSNGSVFDFKHPRQVSLDTYAGLPSHPLVLQANKCFAPAPCRNVASDFIADQEANQQDGTILTTVDGGAGSFEDVEWVAADLSGKVPELPSADLVTIAYVLDELPPLLIPGKRASRPIKP